jgi:hypothetical protein
VARDFKEFIRIAGMTSWKKRAGKGNCAAGQGCSQTLRGELKMILPDETEAGSAGMQVRRDKPACCRG